MCSLIDSHGNGALCSLEYNIPPLNEENESMVSDFWLGGISKYILRIKLSANLPKDHILKFINARNSSMIYSYYN